jgi:hypothetical protein
MFFFSFGCATSIHVSAIYFIDIDEWNRHLVVQYHLMGSACMLARYQSGLTVTLPMKPNDLAMESRFSVGFRPLSQRTVF